METRYIYILRFTLALTDLILINFCFYLAGFSQINESDFNPDFYRYNMIICNLIWLLSTQIFKLYRQQTLKALEAVYRATWRSIVLHSVLFITILLVSNNSALSFDFLFSFYAKAALVFLLSRFISTWLLTLRDQHSRIPVAVLAMNDGGLKLAEFLTKQSTFNFVGFLDTNTRNKGKSHDCLAIQECIRSAAESGVEEVYVSINAESAKDINTLIQAGEKNCIRIKFVPDLMGFEGSFRVDHMDSFTVLCARKEPLELISNRVKKRLFDIIVSLAVIIFVFSWLYPILAIIIKLQSPGPVMFAQLRTGRNNKPFWCYKFRSMKVNSTSDHVQATRDDDRITPIGRFMRKTSLDEFPQFFNVLLGYMSIIGPRPHMLAHTDLYRQVIDKYMVRQFLKPGISGWAQVNGYRGETKETVQMEKRVEHDIWYMENWTLMLDLKITFLTAIKILKGDNNAF